MASKAGHIYTLIAFYCMYDISMICKIASVLVFIEGSNDKVSIPEIASFGHKKFIVVSTLVRREYAISGRSDKYV